MQAGCRQKPQRQLRRQQAREQSTPISPGPGVVFLIRTFGPRQAESSCSLSSVTDAHHVLKEVEAACTTQGMIAHHALCSVRRRPRIRRHFRENIPHLCAGSRWPGLNTSEQRSRQGVLRQASNECGSLRRPVECLALPASTQYTSLARPVNRKDEAGPQDGVGRSRQEKTSETRGLWVVQDFS